MPNFQYNAKTRTGETRDGTVHAASKKEAMLSLLRDGLQPISVKQIELKVGAKKGGHRITKNDIILFTEELGELLNAGLPLEPALASMANRDEDGPLKEIAGKLRSFVMDGIPFHTALEQTSERFDELYINLVKAGEASGSLGSIINEHALFLKEQAAIRSSLLVALLYPGFLLLACLGAIGLFMFYLLPQISDLLVTTQSGELPTGIKIALASSAFLTTKWPFLVVFLIILIIGLKFLSMKEENRAKWDKVKVELPFYGKVFQYGFFVQWLKTLSNLMVNGVPLSQSLELANQTVSNRHYRESLGQINEQVKDGIKLTTAMSGVGIFPSNMVDLIAVGDETGKMARSVERAARYYENRLGVILKSLISAITPVILIGMALVVGTLCYTLIEAIYGAIGQMRK